MTETQLEVALSNRALQTTVLTNTAPPAAAPFEVADEAIRVYDQMVLRTLPTEGDANPAAAHQAAVRQVASYAFNQGVEATRAAALSMFCLVFGRSGEVFSPELADEELAEIADKAEGTLRRFYDAMQAGLPDPPGAIAALSHLLSVVSAARAALGFDPTPVGRDIITAMRKEDTITVAGDPMRLHLLAVHGEIELTAPDRIAQLIHDRKHSGCTDVHQWDEPTARKIASDVPENMGRASVVAALDATLARIDAEMASSRG